MTIWLVKLVVAVFAAGALYALLGGKVKPPSSSPRDQTVTHQPTPITNGMLLRRARDGVVYRVIAVGVPIPGAQVGIRKVGGIRAWWIQTHRIYREFGVVTESNPKETER